MMEEARPQSGADNGWRTRRLLGASLFRAAAVDSSSDAVPPVAARALQPVNPGPPAAVAVVPPAVALTIIAPTLYGPPPAKPEIFR